MANKGITQLQVATALTGLEPFPLVQNGVTKQALISEVAALARVTLVADDTTATPVYPVFADTTVGDINTLYTSDPNYLYTPATGTLEATAIQADNALFYNPNTIAQSVTISASYNALSAGPITVPSGVTVTTAPGSVWTIV